MPTAIALQLNYHLHTADTCYTAWKVIQQCFIEAGFRVQEHLFIIGQPLQWAAELAETALQEAGQRLRRCGLDLHSIVSDRTAYEYPATGAAG